MKKKYKVKVTKCYLIQIVDEEDCEMEAEYVYHLNTKKEALEYGKNIMLNNEKYKI